MPIAKPRSDAGERWALRRRVPGGSETSTSPTISGLTTLLTADGLQPSCAPSCSRVREPDRRMLATTCRSPGVSAGQPRCAAPAATFFAGEPLTVAREWEGEPLLATVCAMGN